MITAVRAVFVSVAIAVALVGCNSPNSSKTTPPVSVCEAPLASSPSPGAVSEQDAIAAARSYLQSHGRATATVSCGAALFPAAQLQSFLNGQAVGATVWVVVARGGIAIPEPTIPPGVATPKVAQSPQPVTAVVFLISNQVSAQLLSVSVYRVPPPAQFDAIK